VTRKPFKKEIQSLIYSLYCCDRNIKKLKQELLNCEDETELFLLNGNLQEYKYHKIYFLRELNKKILQSLINKVYIP
jgi:hypothetical protein